VRDVRLDGRAHRRGGAEEPIRRRQSLQRLVRALEVVVLHEQPHPSLAVLEVGKHGARQELLPHRLPESLDLAAGLRVMRAALHVCDPLSTQLRLELRRAAPRRVLPALIGQDLARRTVLGNAARQRLQHQRASLMVRHRQAHQIARVIIQERCNVHALVSAQQKGEQVRLPQLVRLGTLEAHELAPRLRLRKRACRQLPMLAQHTPHRRR
jgi:hypothetical protein